MSHSVIRYTVKPESLDDNRMLVEDLFDDLKAHAPTQISYLVLELDDGEFIHVVEQNGAHALPAFDKFQAFSKDHAARRATPVVRKQARIVGSYRMLNT